MSTLLTLTRINLWHFVWIAVFLSVLLSLLLSELIHRQILWEYPFGAALIALAVASLLIYVIKRMFDREQTLIEALRESQERFTSAFRDAAIGMALVGTDGHWLQVNPALCELVGYTEQELLATTFQAITHPDDLDADLAFVRQMLAGEIRTYQMEKRYFHKQGQIVWILLSVSLVHDPTGGPRYFIGQIQDITARKETERALRESEQLFQAFMDHSPSVAFMKDAQGRYLYVNGRLEQCFNRAARDWLGKTDFELWPPETAQQFRAHDEEALASQAVIERMETTPDPDLGVRHWIVFKFPVQDASGNRCLGGVAVDITERKRAERALYESEARFQAILDNSPTMVFLKDTEGRYLLVNRQFENAFHLTTKEIAGKTDEEIFPPEQAAAFRANDRMVFQARVPLQFEEVALLDDGPHTSIVFKFPLCAQDGRPYALCGITTDITARKQAEEALRESEQRLRQALEDRERLSQDLHDNVIQSIYAIGMALESCHALIEKAPAVAAQRMRSGIADLNGVIKEVRNYIEWASPAILSADQLREGFEDLVRTIPSSCPLAIRLQIDPSALGQLIGEEAMHVLQITREAISNSLRHSRAKTVGVSLCRAAGGLRLEVHDDGIGFDTKSVEGHGLGLRNMAARAGKFKANLTVLSEPGRGTRIILTIPKEHDHASGPHEIHPTTARG